MLAQQQLDLDVFSITIQMVNVLEESNQYMRKV